MIKIFHIVLLCLSLPLSAVAQSVISSVTPPPPKTYLIGENLDFVVTWSTAVTVSGSPRLALNLNGNLRFASYHQGSGTTSLTFRYPIVSGFAAPGGVGIGFPIQLNGGSISDDQSAPAQLTFANRFYGGIIVTSPPPSIISVTPPTAQPGWYVAGQTIDFTVNWSEPMNATQLTSRLTFNVGGINRAANMISGSGTSSFVYRLVIPIDSYDPDGPTIQSPLDLNRSVITSVATGAAPSRTFTPPSLADYEIDGRVPTVVANTKPASISYMTGDQLNFLVTYSRAVTVSGNPRIQINVGIPPTEVTKYANYVSGSGTTELLFRYTVQSGDSDLDGVFFNPWLELSQGSIVDAVGNSIAYAFWGMKLVNAGYSTAYLNWFLGPTVSTVSVPTSGFYGTGNTLDFTVQFSAPVLVSGNPSLSLVIGAQNRSATYVSGSGTNSLLFRYTVQASDQDLDGITLQSPIVIGSGSISDSSANSADPTFTPPNTTGVKVAGTMLVTSITPPANGTYRAGQTLDFTVAYSGAATVTGSPRIQLQVGAATLYATYLSGSGTSSHVFRYTVGAGETDADGIATIGPAILLNGGTIKTALGADVTLDFTAAQYPSKRIDTTAPLISAMTASPNATYTLGQNISFTATFSEVVTVTGSPRLSLTVGATASVATYVSGSNSNQLVFTYTVPSGALDTNGIALSNTLALNGGTILDAGGNALTPLTFTLPNLTGVNVDGVAPTITSITPPANGTYTAGAALTFIANFSDLITVTGTPVLQLTVGSSTINATYTSGTGTTAIRFTYTVQSGQNDNNGIATLSPINLNGGLLRDGSGNNAVLTFTATTLTAVFVDTSLPAVTSITPPADGIYRSGQALNFTVAYSAAATVTGTPRIQLTVGATTVYATYVSGSGTASHIYRYTVAAGQTDTDGIATVGPAIQLNGGTIRNALSTDFNLTFTAAQYPNKRIDTTAPLISSMTASPNATYTLGQSISFTATYSEVVTVTGSPRLSLTVGATASFATYVSGSNSNQLVFTYTVPTGALDNNGIALSNTLALNGGTILDAAGNAQAPLTFTVPTLAGVNVDGTVPTITSLTPPANGAYGAGAALVFIANFSEAITVTGTPVLQLTVGSSTINATYTSGTGTTAIRFTYTVQSGQNDTNGITTLSPLNLNGGTLRDASGNNAVLTFTATTLAGVIIDTSLPAITSITPPADGIYRSGQALNFTVAYTSPATVTGTPRIQLTVGAATLYATYVSGSGTASHVFRYTVAAGQTDTDGIATVGPAIQLNGGTIRNALATNFDLTFTAAQYPNKRIDTTAPLISTMTVSPNATYTQGQSISFTATYSEVVSVTGSPRLSLTVGATASFATYVSGSNSNQLIFTYTVPAGALDTNGITVSNTLALNGGTILDAAGNAQTPLTFTAPTLTNVRVDAVSPTISSVTPPANATYTTAGNMNFTVNFSEAIAVTGSPALQFVIGTQTVNATYLSGSGTTAIVFRYTVVANDNDTNGVNTLSPLVLNGGTLKDLAGNNTALTFTAATLAAVRVDTAAPVISSVTLPADATYKSGGTRTQLNFNVTFNENVTVTGTPRLHLSIGAATVFATYISGTGTSILSFRYTVAAADVDLDGIGIGNGGAIDLNGGSIRDAVAIAPTSLYLGSLATGGIKVIFSAASRWYDISDTATLQYSGLLVTGITDKVGTYNLTHTGSGATYEATGFNGGTNAYVSCTSGTSFNGASATTPTTMVAVFRAPPNVTSQYLFYATAVTRPMIQFSSTAAGGTVAFGVTGRTYRSANWSTTGTTLTNLWTSGTAMARTFSWTSTQTRVQSLCQMDGELAEAFFFTTQPTAAQMAVIDAYLTSRYDLAFP